MKKCKALTGSAVKGLKPGHPQQLVLAVTTPTAREETAHIGKSDSYANFRLGQK